MAVIGSNAGLAPHLRENLTLTLMEPGARTTSPPRSHADRPASVLARGVQIMECHNTLRNPDCVTPDECLLLDDYLSPRKLRDLTGKEDLCEVSFLEMNVDTRETSLGNFGDHLPRLTQLKLSGSIIPSIRDLGSSLHSLAVLWMAQCGLQELDSISSLNCLRELYVAYNEINDISPCSMLETLQVLDLEGNNLMEFTQIEFLALCPALTNLTLEGNPVCLTPSPDETATNYDYKAAVRAALPQLRYLDDEFTLSAEVGESKANASVFDEDWKLLQELMEEGTMVDPENELNLSGRPTSAGFRPATSSRPCSALRPNTSSSWRPLTSGRSSSLGSSGGRPATGGMGRSSTADSDSVSAEDLDSASSDLTRGGVVCGNPSKALKLRRKCLQAGSDSCANDTPFFTQFRNATQEETPSRSHDTESNVRNLLIELKDWKIQHQMESQDIAASKTAQVLKIDHSDDVLSSSDGSNEEDGNLSEDDFDDDESNYQISARGTLLKETSALSITNERHLTEGTTSSMSKHGKLAIGETSSQSNAKSTTRPESEPKCRSKPIIAQSPTCVNERASPLIGSPLATAEKETHATHRVGAERSGGPLKGGGDQNSPPSPLPSLIRARRGRLAAVPLLPSKYTK